MEGKIAKLRVLNCQLAGGKKQGEKGMHHRAKMKTGKPRKLSHTMEDTPTRKSSEEAGDCPSHASRKRTLLYTRRHFLEYSAKFREILVKIGAKFDEKTKKLKIAVFCKNLSKNPKKFHEILLKF